MKLVHPSYTQAIPLTAHNIEATIYVSINYFMERTSIKVLVKTRDKISKLVKRDSLNSADTLINRAIDLYAEQYPEPR